MSVQINKIHVENFKSLKDFEITFNKFNILIGSNGSGKTNVLELFKFVNLCINPRHVPAYSFAPWGGFSNIVWFRDVYLPISFSIDYDMDKYQVRYSASIHGKNEKAVFETEELYIKDYIKCRRNFNKINYKFDSKYLETNGKVIDKASGNPNGSSQLEDLLNSHGVEKPINVSFLKDMDDQSWFHAGDPHCLLIYHEIKTDGRIKLIEVPSPAIHENDRYTPLLISASNVLTKSDSIVLLRQLNYDVIRKPPLISESTALKENGEGLINLLFEWYLRSKDHLPEIFELALETLFPKWQIRFTVMRDGRILLHVTDGNIELDPPSIPDGFYKLLAILAAIELKPTILLIDEIETSLHAKIIEYVIASLKTCDANVVLTTHSPTVIDAVDLQDIIMLENTQHISTCSRITDPEDFADQLREKGITVSESWIYAGK